MSMFVSKQQAAKYMKQKLIGLEGGMDRSPSTVEDVNTLSQ